tara:strand:- start:4916 stop:5398 length:483 start_codon:yes stop_codon:yes gene_type:complete
MDILTERGQKSLEYERKMLERIRNSMCNTHEKNSMLIETNKNTDAKVDGIIIKNNELSGIFESKCRDLSLMELRNFGSWLVTFDKIMDGKRLSEMLRVPYIGFLYLIKDEIVMYWKITDKHGNFLFDFDVRNTRTQKTINGGSVVRTNAYLPFKEGSELL